VVLRRQVKAPTSFSGLRVTEVKLIAQSDFKLIILASISAAVPEPVPTKLPFGVNLNMTMGKIVLTVEKPFTNDYKLTIGAEAEWRVKNVVLSVSADLSAMAAGFGGRISGGVAVGSPDQQLGIGDLAGMMLRCISHGHVARCAPSCIVQHVDRYIIPSARACRMLWHLE
jgi:hypothetical protein